MTLRQKIAVGGIVALLVLAAVWRLRGDQAPKHQAAVATQVEKAAPAAKQAERSGELGPLGVEADDDPKGALRLEGQVVDGDAHGVAGATVVLAANPARTVTTEADGGFAFDGLLARPYTLSARGAKGAAGPVTVRLTATSDPVILKLRPAGAVTVQVVGASGKPIDGATVELRGIDVQRAIAKAGTATIRPVVPGNYQLAAWADGMARSFAWLHVGVGDTSARIVLAVGAPVSGKVVDDQGAPVVGARVRYTGASDFRQRASERYDAQVTGSDGRFAFDALPAGSFRFVASHPARAPASSPIVTLDGAHARADVVIAMAVGATVAGHVVDTHKQPVAGARIRIGVAAGVAGFEAPRQATSDAQGAFALRGLPRAALSAIALHDAGSSPITPVDASSGEVANLVLTVELTGAIAGRVVDPKGEPLEGAVVSALPVAGPGDPAQWRLRGLPEDVTDASGSFKLTGLADGSYRVSAAPSRAQMFGRRPRATHGGGDTATAKTGDDHVELVLSPDGSLRGKLAYADGTVPDLFTAGTPAVQQTFGGGDGQFALDGLAPGTYQLELRGPGFQPRVVEVTIEPARPTDVGTITVVKGRSIGGTVVADGKPVPGATVYAGRNILGSGATASSPVSAATAAIAAATKTTTTDDNGAFSLSGFGDGDLALVAEQPDIGRSRAQRLTALSPGQTELVLSLEKYGALHGSLQNAGSATVLVTCQSTSTPGAVFTVVVGSDGAYRFDRLAPDSYKVSATVGTIRTGMHFYSKQAVVASGQDVQLDLSVDPGTVSLAVTITASAPQGIGLVWLAAGAITAATEGELAAQVAAAGPGAYQRATARGGSASLTEIAPGAYSLCVVPLPREVQGAAALSYIDQHGSGLPAFCQAVTVNPAPDAQSVQIPVQLPPFLDDSKGAPIAKPGSPAQRRAAGRDV